MAIRTAPATIGQRSGIVEKFFQRTLSGIRVADSPRFSFIPRIEQAWKDQRPQK
jgi:hypothetical protein